MGGLLPPHVSGSEWAWSHWQVSGNGHSLNLYLPSFAKHRITIDIYIYIGTHSPYIGELHKKMSKNHWPTRLTNFDGMLKVMMAINVTCRWHHAPLALGKADFVQSESIFQSTLMFNHCPCALQGSGHGSMSVYVHKRSLNPQAARLDPSWDCLNMRHSFFKKTLFSHMWPAKNLSLWSQTHCSCLAIWCWWTLTCYR